MCTGDCHRGWLRRETSHSPPSVTEVKNEWSYTSSLPEYLYGVYRYNTAVVIFKLTVLSLMLGYKATVR